MDGISILWRTLTRLISKPVEKMVVKVEAWGSGTVNKL
jgi:hypothetical protein